MNTGWYKWDLIKSYKRKTTSRDTIPGWCPTAVLKEYWSFIVLNKHENKSHACLSPLDVTYVCELSVTCTDSRCTSQVSSSQQTEAFLYQRHRQTWGGTSGRDSNFPTTQGCILFCPIRAGFPNCKSCTITLWMQPIDFIFSAPENSTLIPLFSASSKNLWL